MRISLSESFLIILCILLGCEDDLAETTPPVQPVGANSGEDIGDQVDWGGHVDLGSDLEHMDLSTSDGNLLDNSVLINELMADNELGIVDESGATEDWIELINLGDSAVELSGWMLLDESGNGDSPWVFPDGVIIPADTRLLIWADNDNEEGVLHTDFRLNKEGETLRLMESRGDLVDEVTFPPLLPDHSYGRSFDGDELWQVFENPTPGTGNGI
jgi:hypothetical protein